MKFEDLKLLWAKIRLAVLKLGGNRQPVHSAALELYIALRQYFEIVAYTMLDEHLKPVLLMASLILTIIISRQHK